MPRTNPKPLTIGVIGLDMHQPVIQEFIAKGHTVEDVGLIPTMMTEGPPYYDVITGPLCRRTDPRLKLGDDSTPEDSLRRQWEMMEKGLRNEKYPKIKEDNA